MAEPSACPPRTSARPERAGIDRDAAGEGVEGVRQSQRPRARATFHDGQFPAGSAVGQDSHLVAGRRIAAVEVDRGRVACRGYARNIRNTQQTRPGSRIRRESRRAAIALNGDSAGDGVGVIARAQEVLNHATIREQEIAARKGESKGGRVAKGDAADVAIGVHRHRACRRERVGKSGYVRAGQDRSRAWDARRPAPRCAPVASGIDIPRGVGSVR